MFYNAKPANTLFAKVSVKKHPYSGQPISIVVTAAMYPEFKSNTALFISELPLENCNMLQIQSVVDSFQRQANAVDSFVTIRPPVFKYVSADVA